MGSGSSLRTVNTGRNSGRWFTACFGLLRMQLEKSASAAAPTGLLANVHQTHHSVSCYLLCSPWLKNVCGVAASDITSKPQNMQRLKAALMSERQNMQLLSTALHIKTPQTTLYIRPFGCFSLLGRQTWVQLVLSANIPSVCLPLFSPLICPFQNLTILPQP